MSSGISVAANARFLNLRLKPGEDVRLSLLAFIAKQSLKAASVISAVGSLKQASLRYADGKSARILHGSFEIVALSGTLGEQGLHIHLALADNLGEMTGGHLMEGCLVHTTLELVILEQSGLEFHRVMDPATGYRELEVIETQS